MVLQIQQLQQHLPRQWRRPHIYSPEEIRRLLDIRVFVDTDPEPFAGRIPLRRGVVHVTVDAGDLSRDDLTLEEWLMHGCREAMDLGLYLRRAAQKAETMRAELVELRERLRRAGAAQRQPLQPEEEPRPGAEDRCRMAARSALGR